MVSHQDTVPTTYKPEAGVPGDEEQEDEAGCTQDDLPGHRDQPARLANSDGQDPQGRHLGVKPQPGSRHGVQFRAPAWPTVVHQREGHAVKVVESVVQGVVAVVSAGFTVYTLMPLS